MASPYSSFDLSELFTLMEATNAEIDVLQNDTENAENKAKIISLEAKLNEIAKCMARCTKQGCPRFCGAGRLFRVIRGQDHFDM